MAKAIRTIAVDLDGVCVDLIGKTIERYNDRFGAILEQLNKMKHGMARKVTIEDLHCWDLDKCVPHGKAIFDPFDEEGFWGPENLAPIEGAIQGVNGLQEAGYDVYIVTSPWLDSRTCEQEKRDWCRLYLPFIPEKHIVFMHCKERFSADLLIDDSPKHCRNFLGDVICFAQPWNQEVNDLLREQDEAVKGDGASRRTIARCDGWDHVAAYMRNTYIAAPL